MKFKLGLIGFIGWAPVYLIKCQVCVCVCAYVAMGDRYGVVQSKWIFYNLPILDG